MEAAQIDPSVLHDLNKNEFKIPEIAELFEVEPERVRIWIRTKDLTATKIRGKWTCTKQNLIDFAMERYGL